MSWNEVGNTVCPIARSLAVVGDRWTGLILREMFLGTKRFEEFQAQTGMSSHLLSTRLKRLEGDGIIARRPYQDRPVRHEYRLTDKGLDLYSIPCCSASSPGAKNGAGSSKGQNLPLSSSTGSAGKKRGSS